MNKKDQYCETHHIVPRSFGGSDDDSNLVNFTAKEHYVAHKLLVKICKSKYGTTSDEYKKMVSALFFMTHHSRYNDCKITSKMYAIIKEEFSKNISEKYKGSGNPMAKMTGSKNPMWGVDVRTRMTPEAVKEMSRKRSEALRRRVRKQSTFKKLSEGKMGALNPMYHKPTEQMPHYNKKCMRCIATGEYKYVEKTLVDEYLKSGWELRGNNRGTKRTEKTRVKNRENAIGRKNMIHPITKDRKNPKPKDFQKFLDLGYVFVVRKGDNDGKV